MNRILLLLISICFMTQSKSQEQKEFVEIVAEDTLHVEPEEIFYVVMLSSSYANSDTVFMENTPPVNRLIGNKYNKIASTGWLSSGA